VQERIKGLEAGADDFLIKPIHPPELIARVRSLLRIKRQIERLERLKRFFSPKLADLIVSGGAGDPLVPHRRDIVVVFLDLRGFTALAERVAPEELMGVLREYHEAMGELILAHEGTLERFGGDSIMVFFNDPVPLAGPAARAVAMACAMRERFRGLAHAWSARGHRLGLGLGLAQGPATLGAIGFEGRWDYAAIGPVTNLAARLCAEAADGEILLDEVTLRAVGELVESRPAGERALKGFARPVATFNVVTTR
jgi:class 3 adenylate cyclase